MLVGWGSYEKSCDHGLSKYFQIVERGMIQIFLISGGGH